MKDLSNPNWIKLKGLLFLLVGSVSAVLLYRECPAWRTAVLILITIWSFCRFYYFAFYVIEHYVDSSFRFSGLVSFARYLISKRHR